MMRAARITVLAAAFAACHEPLDQRLAIVDEPRVLAIRSEPAEAKPGTEVRYRALLAGPEGPLTELPRWAFCTAPKPPTEDNVVSSECIGPDLLVDLGTTDKPSATLPSDGCRLFGPDTPPGEFRPRDPDATGGYYQPVRADVLGDIAFGLSRITCKLPTAPTQVARDYDLHYVTNENPVLEPFVFASAPASSAVTLTASWPADSVEAYLYYDALGQRLVERREAMRVSWYATAGALDVDASAVGEDDSATSVSTTWHTPASGEAWLWIVLRDSRGGIAWQQTHVIIE